MATHSNGLSARQMWRQLGLGSYKSAWLLCAKLRRAMVNPARALLSGVVEIDETQVSYRTKDDPVTGGGGRSPDGKMQVAVAVEIIDEAPGRLRLGSIEDASSASLHPFIKANVAAGSTLKTDGCNRAAFQDRRRVAVRADLPAPRARIHLITSNLPFDEWTETFGSERLTGALLDRLTHRVHILEMNGDSYRLSQSKARKTRPKPDPRAFPPKGQSALARASYMKSARAKPLIRSPRQIPTPKMADFSAATWPVFAPPLTTGFKNRNPK